MSDDRNIRHRFTVPAADNVVNEWIEKQSNLGFSIRTLIKAFVKAYGYQDATCLEFGTAVKRRGRPPKQVQIQYDNMMDVTSVQSQDDLQNDSEVEEVLPAFVETNPMNDAVMGMFNNTSIPQNIPQPKPNQTSSANTGTTNITSDDDGFVDPESLF